ncbi:hypothetical protein NPE70_002550 [Salmonella enterica]|nr:hypothetical protein [Salmonella enterica]
MPDGRCALFRFYDPRILAEVEFLLDETHYVQLINRTTIFAGGLPYQRPAGMRVADAEQNRLPLAEPA